MTDRENRCPTVTELFEIPPEGMLGLLAYGAQGLLDWRKKRAQVEGANWRDKLAAELSAKVGPESQEAGNPRSEPKSSDSSDEAGAD